jgi:2-polyprenyl-6-hydroxyphenyl methylase/3-demethylubiquinone-9 3-methyltransferase
MATSADTPSGYRYADASASHTNAYLMPHLRVALAGVTWPAGPRRVFDLGCGNGAMAAELTAAGYTVTGVDPSEEGIRLAREHYPGLDLHPGSAYDDLAGRYGRFPVVVSLEVVEHLYYPRKFAQAVFDLLTPGGIAVVSTPYHGYWKNLALAVTGKLDAHFTALWDHGHIKFWSPRTLTALLAEAGLTVDRVIRAGRVPVLAKSMILVARKPV